MRSLSLMSAPALALCLLMPTDLRAEFIMIEARWDYEEVGGNQDRAFGAPDGAPVGDQFFITHGSDPGVRISRVVINLATSATPSVFDIAASAGGTAGRDPAFAFQTTQGAVESGFVPPATVTDGSPTLTMNFNNFIPGTAFGFMIDVDNAAGDVANDQRFVPGAEFAGATITLTFVLPGGFEITRTGTYTSSGGNTAGGMLMETVEIPRLPEPASWSMFALSALGLAAYGWLRRRQAA